MTKAANVITMTYTADGEKLSKALTGGSTKNYISGIEYSGANLEALYFSEGRCTPIVSDSFNYEYTIKDHLGNARVNFRAGAGATLTHLENMHYYPFGMLMEGMGTNSPSNDYTYNGKELNEDFGVNLSDYGARWYDAALGRWWSVDPLAEKYQGWSGYNYGMDNPVRFVDPDGRKVDDYVYLNTKGEEIGRIKDNSVHYVTIIKDENIQAFDNLPYGRESIFAASLMGVTYDLEGVLSLYENSISDIIKVDPITHLDASGNKIEDINGKPKQGIALEHGASLKLHFGKVVTTGDVRGNPTSVPMDQSSPYNDIVGTAHSHPNEGKGTTRINSNYIADFNSSGPSDEYDLGHLGAPKSGYYNIVVDRSNVYFFNKNLQSNNIITISRKKL